MDRAIKKKKWKKWLLGAVMAVGAASAAVYHLYFRDVSTKLNVNKAKIIVSTVSEDSFQEFIPILGKVLPVTTVYLDAIEGGRVEQKFVEAGAWVKKGDRILQLSNLNLVLNLMQREGEYFNQADNVQKTRLSMEQYRLNHTTIMTDLNYQIKTEKRQYDQNTVLFGKNMISQQQYFADMDKYQYLREKKRLAQRNFEQEMRFRKIQIEQLEASLKRVDSNLDIIRKRLDSLTIRAPLTGQLTVLNVEMGESKALGQRLGQINVMTDLKVKAGIDEHYISRIEKGRMGTFDFAGSTSEVEVVKIFPEVREGQFLIEMKFSEKPPEGVRIGLTLRVKLALGDLSSAVILARGGFYQSTAGQWVYVLDRSSDFAVKRKVRLGRQNSEVFEVLKGLKPGEKVITSNYDNFENMDKLVLK
ncbi:MAG: HlyD family efflux transporter periplasmic adaptor subunit [Proteobacteria bacterium]|nr:HlyD family efflux transporter periplasmic adaptor subunit [Pseudomonadota bacterium]